MPFLACGSACPGAYGDHLIVLDGKEWHQSVALHESNYPARRGGIRIRDSDADDARKYWRVYWNASGRDHNPKGFTVWLTGAGVKRGFSYGATDEFGYNVAENPVHVHDLQATILQQLGMDHTRLTFRFQGRDYRLTDVAGELVKDILA